MLRRSPNRYLRIENLESRSLMAGIPELSSMPGAPNTIYLDFDGHFEPVWRDSSEGRDYLNVWSQAYDRDGKADYSTQESLDIRRAWDIVSEDFQPFNVNVTTVAPASIDPRVLRVVIGGQELAQYLSDGRLNWSAGSNFLVTRQNTPATGSGVSSIGSFTDDQPNTVYVFSDSLMGGRRLNAEEIGNTASHEAGHALGLLHHQRLVTTFGTTYVADEYHSGNELNTPIMGNNLVSVTKHTWSNSTNFVGSQDQIGILTSVLGLRPDDVGDGLATAQSFPLTSTFVDPRTLENVRLGQTWATINTTGDADAFAFRTTNGNVSINVGIPLDGNLDARLQVFRIDTFIRLVNGIRRTFSTQTMVADVDPTSFRWYNTLYGFGAAWQSQLASGNYLAVVRSHGSYGDMGQYQLTIVERTPIDVNRSVSSGSAISTPQNSYSAVDLAFASFDGDGTFAGDQRRSHRARHSGRA